jgi:hypothetical protein
MVGAQSRMLDASQAFESSSWLVFLGYMTCSGDTLTHPPIQIRTFIGFRTAQSDCGFWTADCGLIKCTKNIKNWCALPIILSSFWRNVSSFRRALSVFSLNVMPEASWTPAMIVDQASAFLAMFLRSQLIAHVKRAKSD